MKTTIDTEYRLQEAVKYVHLLKELIKDEAILNKLDLICSEYTKYCNGNKESEKILQDLIERL